jgi:CRP/FNR family transcriptional regulator, cyclic AMP receptor protein
MDTQVAMPRGFSESARSWRVVDVAAPLARVPLFIGLPTAALAPLGASLRRRRYAKGEAIFRQGDPGAALCIVESGRVKIALGSAEGKEFVLELMGPGDVFGELALLDGQARSADAVAAEETTLLLLPREAFLRAVEAHPRVALELLKALTGRLRRDAAVIQDAAFLDVPTRIARALLRLAEAPEEGGDDAMTPAWVTQTELARLVGATRESVNKWLGSYERQGLIRRRDGRIAVLRPDDLQRRVRRATG